MRRWPYISLYIWISSLSHICLFSCFRFRFISSNSENPGDKFYDTIVEVLPSYHKEKKDGVLEMKEQEEAKFNTTEDGFIQVGKS